MHRVLEKKPGKFVDILAPENLRSLNSVDISDSLKMEKKLIQQVANNIFYMFINFSVGRLLHVLSNFIVMYLMYLCLLYLQHAERITARKSNIRLATPL